MMFGLFSRRVRRSVRGGAAGRPRGVNTGLRFEACEPRCVLSATALVTVTPVVALEGDVIPAEVWTAGEGESEPEVWTLGEGESEPEVWALGEGDEHGDEHGDVEAEVLDGRIVVQSWSHGYEYELDTTIFDVGFDVTGLAEGSVLQMEVLQGVTFWNGRGTPTFTPARGGVELNFNNAAEDVRVGVSRNVGRLLEIGPAEAVEGGTEVHGHFDVTIGRGGSSDTFGRDAPAGIYVVIGRLVSDGVASSVPMAFVFNVGASEEAHEAAVEAFTAGPPVSVLSVATPEPGLYKAGAPITITAEFSSPVLVQGTPRLPITVGGKSRFATFDRAASSGENVAFTYVLKRNDNGLVAANGQIQTPGKRSSIAGAAGGPVFMQAAIAFAQGVVADTTPPRVVGVLERTGEGTYGAGATLDFVVRMSEPIVVNVAGGRPTVPVAAIRGATLGSAEYVEVSAPPVSSADELLFRFTITSGQQAPRGVSLKGGVVGNGGIITDAAGNPATLSFRQQKFPLIRIVTA